VLLRERTSVVTHLVEAGGLARQSRCESARGIWEAPSVKAIHGAGSIWPENGDTRADSRSRYATRGYGVPIRKDDQIARGEERREFSLSDVLERLDPL
jgi:hypothetical protein